MSQPNKDRRDPSLTLSESSEMEKLGITPEMKARVETFTDTLEAEPVPELNTDEQAIAQARQNLAVATENSMPGNNLPALNQEQSVELSLAIDRLEHGARWAMPALFKGNKTATEYDSKVTNYSTKTEIVELSDGRKVFLVFNYPTSWIHRGMDAMMKKLTGCKMSKSSSRDWKQTFESRSRIPTLPIDNPEVVALPFIPNINAYDLFANRKQINDFGECSFAQNITPEQLLKILEKITHKITEAHQEGVTWGELILHNVIVDKDENPYICDPETRYDADVPLLEQKARDLMDFITSAAAALNQNDSVPYTETVARIIATYPDQTVIAELGNLAKQKPKILHRLFFGYTKVRLGLKNQKELGQIKKAIVDTITK